MSKRKTKAALARADRDTLIAALENASTANEIVAAECRIAWANSYNGEICPAGMIPSEAALAEWYPQCPAEAKAEAARILSAIAWHDAIDGLVAYSNLDPHMLPSWEAETRYDLSALEGLASEEEIATAIRTAPQIRALMAHVPTDADAALTFHAGMKLLMPMVHQAWRIMPMEKRPDHPLRPLVRAWQEWKANQPSEIMPEQRKDRRILPVVRSGALIPERQRGMLFGGLLEGRDPSPELPLFEAVPIRKSVAILDLADAAGVPIMAQGRGAPLSARLFVRAGLAVQPEDRKRQSIRMAVTVRELRDGLYPNGWRIGKHWSDLKVALIGARDYTIRLPDGGLWFMLALRKLPSEDKHGQPRLDDHVVLDMAFPPNSSDGPVIDLPTLDALSVKSAPRWRAYIAAHALTWEPGKTRRRNPKTRRFVWSLNPADYPILTIDDRRRLAFGETDRKNRTREDVDAPWRDLPGLVMIEQAYDQRTGEAGWRIMPDEAAPDEGEE